MAVFEAGILYTLLENWSSRFSFNSSKIVRLSPILTVSRILFSIISSLDPLKNSIEIIEFFLGASVKVNWVPPSKTNASPGTCNISFIKTNKLFWRLNPLSSSTSKLTKAFSPFKVLVKGNLFLKLFARFDTSSNNISSPKLYPENLSLDTFKIVNPNPTWLPGVT